MILKHEQIAKKLISRIFQVRYCGHKLSKTFIILSITKNRIEINVLDEQKGIESSLLLVDKKIRMCTNWKIKFGGQVNDR